MLSNELDAMKYLYDAIVAARARRSRIVTTIPHPALGRRMGSLPLRPMKRINSESIQFVNTPVIMLLCRERSGFSDEKSGRQEEADTEMLKWRETARPSIIHKNVAPTKAAAQQNVPCCYNKARFPLGREKPPSGL